MTPNFLKQGLGILLKRQTNILSAALILMITVVLSQFLGLVRQRLLVSIFGASNSLGVYLAASRLPDFVFQITIAAALSSAFIPVFTDLLSKGKEQEANKMASTLLTIGFIVFFILSILLFIFAPLLLQLLNLGSGFTVHDMNLMVSLTRIIIVGELFFLIGTFFSALLQSHNHFFIPGIAAALYNFGIILGILFLSKKFGIYSPAYGVILGAIIFVIAQIPLAIRVGFKYRPTFSFKTLGVFEVSKLIWPRATSILIFQLGLIITVSLISFLPSSGRNYVIFDYAQTLSFAPIVLFGQSIAQAAFPVLAREKDRLNDFRITFLTSFNQLFYLVLPISVIFLILRIPIVRLVYGAAQFDWQATLLTGRTLAFFTISIFAQALVYLVSRGFYALHDTRTPLLVGAFSTLLMVLFSAYLILFWNSAFSLTILHFTFSILPKGVEGIALAYSVSSLVNLLILMFFLDKKIGKLFSESGYILSQLKIILCVVCMGFALYIPIRLLDQLVFDTTKTVGLVLLTGISSFAGLGLYFFLTWFFNVKEAGTFLLLFRRLGNWRDILGKSENIVEHKINQ